MKLTATTILLFTFFATYAQLPAKAISYKVQVDLNKLDPSFDESDGNQRFFDFEVDAYYTDTKVKTVVRKIGKHPDNGVTIRQRLYTINSLDEYNIDAEQQYILYKQNQVVKPKSTGRQKEIMGFKCRELTFTDYRGVDIAVWVTDKMQKNICALGNYSLKGSALEMNTSNGLSYVATDFAEGVVDSSFFDIPQGYQEEVMVVSKPDK